MGMQRLPSVVVSPSSYCPRVDYMYIPRQQDQHARGEERC